MPHAARQPARITGLQNRLLHKLAADCGLDHDALRDVAGVSSLKHLTVADARALIDRFKGEAARPRLRLVNTDLGDASRKQRDKIHRLFCDLGWSRAKCRGWLQRRYGISNHYEDELETGVASAIITHLTNALNRGPGGRTGSTCGTGGTGGSPVNPNAQRKPAPAVNVAADAVGREVNA